MNIALLAADMFEMERGYRADPKDLAQWCVEHGCKWMGYSVESFNLFGEEWSERKGEIGSWSIPTTPITNRHGLVRGFNALDLVRWAITPCMANSGQTWDEREREFKSTLPFVPISNEAIASLGLEIVDQAWSCDTGRITMRCLWIEGDNTFDVRFRLVE